jgi:hypothetical protein
MAGAAEPRQVFQPIKYHRQPGFQQGPFDLIDFPVQDQERCTPAELIECEERDGGFIMIDAGLGRGVDDRKHAVATFGGFVARLESFLVTKTQCDPIAEGIKKIVLSLIVLVANSEILDLIDEMVF